MRNTWDPNIRLGWIIGLLITASLVGITIILVATVLMQPISIWTFLMSVGATTTLAFAIRLIYQLWGLINASYEMDRNGIMIHWGGTHHQIPMQAVQTVFSGADLDKPRMQFGLRWPGYFVGLGHADSVGDILFYATRPSENQAIIKTEGMAYAISPEDLEEFLQAMRERLEMGPTQEVEEQSTHPAFLGWEIWKDRIGLITIVGSMILLTLLVGLLCWRYPYLPPEIAMRFTPAGNALLIAKTPRIFYLPLMGVIFLLLNTSIGLLLYHRERTVTYFVWSGMLAVQSGLWTAVVTVLLRQ